MAIRIILGSKSPLKEQALREACDELGLSCVIECRESKPDVPSQPYGEEQTKSGAYNRAKSLRSALGEDPPPTWVLGMENGVVEEVTKERRTAYADYAELALLHTDGSAYFARSESLEFPAEAVAEAKRLGVTVGSVIAATTGCAHDDPHSFLTGGTRSRKDILKDALRALFAYVRVEHGELD